jgi:hypothetical protein
MQASTTDHQSGRRDGTEKPRIDQGTGTIGDTNMTIENDYSTINASGRGFPHKILTLDATLT